MKQGVYDEYIEHILERVDNTVEHSLQLGDPFDSLQRPQDAKHPQRLYGAQVLSRRWSPNNEKVIKG